MQDKYEMAPSYSPPPASSPQQRSGFLNQHGPAGRDEEEEHNGMPILSTKEGSIGLKIYVKCTDVDFVT